jgi:hypothetical protein
MVQVYVPARSWDSPSEHAHLLSPFFFAMSFVALIGGIFQGPVR